MLDLLDGMSYIASMERAERFRKIKLDLSLRELKRAQNDMDVSYQDLLYMDIIYFHPETTVSYISDVLNIAGTAVTRRMNCSICSRYSPGTIASKTITCSETR